MNATAPHWIERCEAALAGKAAAEVEILRGRRPPLIDATTIRALVTPVMAAVFWAAATFREGLAGFSLDALALLLRLLALAFSVRALIFLAQLGRRLRTWAASGRWALALTGDGALLRTPRADLAIARADVVDVVEPGRWGDRAGRRWSEVHVVTTPESGRLYVTIPPVLDGTPGMLAERLMRWRGRAPEAAAPSPEVEPLASKLWEKLRAGERPAGVAVIAHGRGWLWRGPWTTVLLGTALLEGWFRLPENATTNVGTAAPLVALLCLVLAPVGWFLWTRRELGPRGGMALVLTPNDFLVRTRAGVQRFPWKSVAKVELDTQRAWTLLQGSHPARSIAFRRKNEAPVAIAESVVAAPPEAVVALADAYRKRASAAR